MRVGVISDSHGADASLALVLERMELGGKPDVLIHLGDGGEDAAPYLSNYSQSFRVRGNWDSYMSALPMEEKVILDGVPLLLTHGYTYRVKGTRELLLARAQELGVGAALYGHTHIPHCSMSRGILLLNPGSCREGRYAILKLQNGLIEPVLY
jgi:uncharacterized protein